LARSIASALPDCYLRKAIAGAGTMLKRVNYDDRQHANYRRGRAMQPERIAQWMAAFAQHLPPERPLALVDLGSGVGRLTPSLAEAFGGPVTGVEPSAKMRAVAEETAAHPGVVYRPGEAAAIPLPDRSVDGVVMFLSLHHVADRAAAAREIGRVLKPGGRLFIRSAFAEYVEAGGEWWYQFFPRAADIERQMFPSLAEVKDVFAAAGFVQTAFVELTVQFWASAAEAAEKLRMRTFSTFEHMSEAEIAEGMSRLDAFAAAETVPTPVTGMSDLAVFERS
jgi:ubiquinone/menaquinone biosynthesis C-methylase UbiE